MPSGRGGGRALDTNPPNFANKAERADELRHAIPCHELANLLKVKGTGQMRQCPRCRGDQGGGLQYTLAVSQDQVECMKCRFQVDGLDFVRVALGVNLDQAVDWMEQRLKERQRRTAKTEDSDRKEQAHHAEILGAFMEFCRPLPQVVAQALNRWGIDTWGLKRFGLAYYFHGYRQALRILAQRFGQQALQDVGLLREFPSRRAEGGTRVLGAFEPYRAASVPYLVIPYLRHGQPVCLQARPLSSASKSGVKPPPVLGTTEKLPCLFNVDALEELVVNDEVILVRNELDAMGLACQGFTAVACQSLSQIRADWVRKLSGRRVILVWPQTRQDDPRLENLCLMFDAAGVNRPQVLWVNADEAGWKLVRRLGKELGQGELPEEPPDRQAVSLDSTVGDEELSFSIGVSRFISESSEQSLELEAVPVRAGKAARANQEGREADPPVEYSQPLHSAAQAITESAADDPGFDAEDRGKPQTPPEPTPMPRLVGEDPTADTTVVMSQQETDEVAAQDAGPGEKALSEQAKQFDVSEALESGQTARFVQAIQTRPDLILTLHVLEKGKRRDLCLFRWIKDGEKWKRGARIRVPEQHVAELIAAISQAMWGQQR